MKQVQLTRKHKIALTSGELAQAGQDVLSDLLALGFVEDRGSRKSGEHVFHLTDEGKAKAKELRDALGGGSG